MSAEAGPYYLDSSALSKFYLPEKESASVDRFLQANRGVLCSSLAQAEFASALSLRVRSNVLSEAEVERLWASFQQDLLTTAFQIVDTSVEDVRAAAALIRQYGSTFALRTLDAIHLASARNLGARGFVSFDARQLAVAARMGFEMPALT